ncbi:MAG: ribosome maturation factor RimP [Desulfatirhabdiaceae bacterium]
MNKDDRAPSKFKKPVRPRARISPEVTAEVIRQVEALATPLCLSEGMELVHVEYQRESSGVILRVYIDKPGGVTLNDCVNISRQLSDILEVHLEIAGVYNLEVSSPGVDRPLSKPADYDRFRGHLARIKTRQAIDGQKIFTGVLAGLTDGRVTVTCGQKTVVIPHEEISRAKLVNYNGEI